MSTPTPIENLRKVTQQVLLPSPPPHKQHPLPLDFSQNPCQFHRHHPQHLQRTPLPTCTQETCPPTQATAPTPQHPTAFPRHHPCLNTSRPGHPSLKVLLHYLSTSLHHTTSPNHGPSIILGQPNTISFRLFLPYHWKLLTITISTLHVS